MWFLKKESSDVDNKARELIEKAVQTLGLKIREYDPAENLYKIASDYELDEDTIKDIAQKLMESGFVKEVILGD